MSRDGGLPLLRQLDRRQGLTRALARGLPDPRAPDRIAHSLLSLVRQRIYGLAAGYEDLNGHDTRRHDLVWQTAVERDRPLASNPTLCRLDNRANRAAAWAMHGVIVDQFIAAFAAPDDRVPRRQADAPFHGYYGGYCFLPLYVFCGEQLLASYLRSGHSDARPGTRGRF